MVNVIKVEVVSAHAHKGVVVDQSGVSGVIKVYYKEQKYSTGTLNVRGKENLCIKILESETCPIHVTDKVEDFIEVKCYALNCILKLFPRQGLFPKKVRK